MRREPSYRYLCDCPMPTPELFVSDRLAILEERKFPFHEVVNELRFRMSLYALDGWKLIVPIGNKGPNLKMRVPMQASFAFSHTWNPSPHYYINRPLRVYER